MLDEKSQSDKIFFLVMFEGLNICMYTHIYTQVYVFICTVLLQIYRHHVSQTNQSSCCKSLWSYPLVKFLISHLNICYSLRITNVNIYSTWIELIFIKD